MKETAFIISEYNPFHNGHKFHIDETRKAGAKNVICVMNGNFVQRGEPAVLSKSARAEIAVKNGADLIIELPLKYGISSANYFAKGGIETAAATGIDGTVCFGAKSTALQLRDVSQIMCKAENIDRINAISRFKGVHFSLASQLFLSENCPEYSAVLSDANNILGIEYINALNAINTEMDVFAVERSSISHHDSLVADKNIASAKYIRELISEGRIHEIEKFVPKTSFDILSAEMNKDNCVISQKKYSDIVMARLLGLQADYFTQINGITQGLENKIIYAIKNASSFDSLCRLVKTKRFTYSRIKQALLSSVLNVTREDLLSGVSYLRVLAFNDKGRRLLKEMSEKAKVPVVTKLSDVTDAMSQQAQKDRERDFLSGKIYELCKECPADINPEYLVKPFYSK